MSSADLTAMLRASRPAAPPPLRERVRALVAEPPRREPALARARLPRLRLALPALAAAAVTAAVLVAVVRPAARPHRQQVAAGPAPQQDLGTVAGTPAQRAAAPKAAAAQTGSAAATAGSVPAPTPGRAQDYEAQIGLEVEDGPALSAATKRAMSIARDLGGYVVDASFAQAESGSAQLTLRVPTARVQDAIAQLTSLGRITSQQVQIQDLQGRLDELGRQIDVLRARIAHVTALLQDTTLTPERRAALASEREALQRRLGEARRTRAATASQAADATIQLSLATKVRSAVPAGGSRLDRTLRQAARILTWEGVALLYALVVAGPLAVVAALAWAAARARRRGEERRLLARS